MSSKERTIVFTVPPEKNYTEVPAEAVEELTGGPLRLYSLVLMKNDPSLPDKFYAEQMKISMSTLYRYKQELREAGYIE